MNLTPEASEEFNEMEALKLEGYMELFKFLGQRYLRRDKTIGTKKYCAESRGYHKYLIKRAKGGCLDAQSLLLQCYLKGICGYKKNIRKIFEFSAEGWRIVSCTIREHLSSNSKDDLKEVLLHFAKGGDFECQKYVIEGYSKGLYGFKIDYDAIESWSFDFYDLGKTTEGWSAARDYILDDLSYRFKSKQREIERLDCLGTRKGEYYRVKRDLRPLTPEELKERDGYLQELDDIKDLFEMYHEKWLYNISKSEEWRICKELYRDNKLTELLRWAHKGYEHARYFVCQIYAKGRKGIPIDPIKLELLATIGYLGSEPWIEAEELVIEGKINGLYGFKKDFILAAEYERQQRALWEQTYRTLTTEPGEAAKELVNEANNKWFSASKLDYKQAIKEDRKRAFIQELQNAGCFKE